MKMLKPMKSEKGFSLIEVLIAVGLLGLIGVAFLTALTVTSNGVLISDNQATAESLARSQMEEIKNGPFLNPELYTASLPQEYVDVGYSATIDAETIAAGLQKITITIEHYSEEILILEGYKADR
jgi:prepilin-type N-terminal cleavage/methylation domain-containing protein